MREVQGAPTTEDIREQAAKLGYIVKQSGKSEWNSRSGSWHEYAFAGDPWHITSESGKWSWQSPFRSRTFDTEAEALAGLSEVLRDDARLRALDKYGVTITPWKNRGEFGLG